LTGSATCWGARVIIRNEVEEDTIFFVGYDNKEALEIHMVHLNRKEGTPPEVIRMSPEMKQIDDKLNKMMKMFSSKEDERIEELRDIVKDKG
jgi:hypothetical protein